MKTTFEPGDYVAWYLGITQFRGHVTAVRKGGSEIVAVSTNGVEWHLAPAHQQVDRLPPLEPTAEEIDE